MELDQSSFDDMVIPPSFSADRAAEAWLDQAERFEQMALRFTGTAPLSRCLWELAGDAYLMARTLGA